MVVMSVPNVRHILLLNHPTGITIELPAKNYSKSATCNATWTIPHVRASRPNTLRVSNVGYQNTKETAMRWAKILIGFSAVFTLFTSANASEILVPAHVSEIISAEAVKVKKIVPIARPMLDQTKRLFRTWISPSIDLSRAQMRESRLYSRNTYSQQVNEQQLRLPTERWVTPISGLQQPVMAQAQFSAQTKSQSGNPVKTIYREGPTYFRFQKIKERRAQTRIKDSDAIRLTRDFLMENGFLIETEKDRIGRIEINERRINEDGGEGGKSDDYLVQQDISFRRVFEGKPVINSIITVGLLPDTKEIVLIKHFHWTPLEEKKEVPASSQQVKSVGPVSSSSIVEGIKKKLRASCGSFTKAEIKQVVPAWFQTEDNLIPVLVSVIHTEYPSGYKGPYTDITNLVGSDDIFLGDRKSAVIKPMSPEHDTDPSGTGYSKEGFCRQYAEGALRQISERVERTGPAPANDPVWKKDFNHHYNWCLQAPESASNQGSKGREDWLDQHRQRGALPDPMPKPVDPRSLPGNPKP
jgi:hypothetical protein